MSKKEKLLRRLLTIPADFTWEELTRLLGYFDFRESNKGRSSGSRVRFIHNTAAPVDLHKPHPGSIVKRYVLRNLITYLKDNSFV